MPKTTLYPVKTNRLYNAYAVSAAVDAGFSDTTIRNAVKWLQQHSDRQSLLCLTAALIDAGALKTTDHS